MAFEGRGTLAYRGRRASARSIVAVMLLAASVGSIIVFEADGPDEVEAIAALVELNDAAFGEGR